MTTYYRICLRSDGSLGSLFAKGKYDLKYRLGSSTRELPGTIGIFAFTSLAGLKRYLGELNLTEVIVAGTGTVRQSPCQVSYGVLEEALDLFYSYPKYCAMASMSEIYPDCHQDFAFLSSFTPTEIIEECPRTS